MLITIFFWNFMQYYIRFTLLAVFLRQKEKNSRYRTDDFFASYRIIKYSMKNRENQKAKNFILFWSCQKISSTTHSEGTRYSVVAVVIC